MVNAQEALRAARSGLATALTAALAAVNDPNATPGMVGAAMGGLLQAQTAYNAAVTRIPLTLMHDGQLHEDAAQPESPPDSAPRIAASPDHPAAEIISDNPRVWADRFLAFNKNQGVDRESLTHWFGYALAAGAQSTESARTLWERARGPATE